MNFPSPSDFLDALGIEPLEEDSSEGYFRYLIASNDGSQKFDISFNVVAESFQVIFWQGGVELIRLSSEMTRLLNIRRKAEEVSLYVEFDLPGCTGAAVLIFEPRLHCHWWVLRGAA